MLTTAENGVFIECEIVETREKAILIQQFFGSGSDPNTSARTQWVPKSCVISQDAHGVSIKEWFIVQENLWHLAR